MSTHLHCRSHFSFLEGGSSVEALVTQAARGGIRHLALTDRAGVYAAVDFCRRAESAGIHPVVGAELPVGDGLRAVVLARDEAGYAALCRELTDHHLDPAFDPREALVRLAAANPVLVADPTLLETLLRRGGTAGLAAEVVDHGRPGDRRRNRALIETARRHGLPLCASNDVAFAVPDDCDVHRLLTAIRKRSTLGKLGPGDTASPEAWLKDAARMAALFRELPEAVSGARAVAEGCTFRFRTDTLLYPPFPVPEGETAFSLLWQKAFAGLSARRRPLRPAAIRRLQRELEVICRMGFAEYFLIVRDIVEFATRSNIPLVGRGSAAGSLTAFALGITHVDPLAHDLSFERFLNPERTDPPDIDIDFCWRRRHDVIRYLYERYGEDNTAMLATYVTMAGRMGLRETARALGLPEAEISRFTRHIPYHDARHIDTVLREIPECRNIPFQREPYRTIIRMAGRIAGFPRHLGLHPCGIVLSRLPLHRVVPLQMTATGFAATQFDMRQAEDVGLLKIDILGQRSLTVIADTLAAVREHHGTAIDFSQAPPDDARTWRLVRAGHTMGCFQIESPGMRSLLRKLVPRNMETIIAASSVIRPGPSDAGMLREYIARYHGQRPVTYLHPAMEPLLAGTLGIMVYQEDILRVSEAIAGITPGEGDKLRRAMSSKRSAEAMQALRETFLAKATARDVSPDQAREIWRQMETFSGYAFCKAHSASYAILSWQSAYLKAHYPAEFFAAVISNGGGFYHAAAYALEARRRGVPVLLPHINRSRYDCIAEGRAVRLGLGRVGGLARATADRILAAREAGPFTSFTDFLFRGRVEREEAADLIRCGALDCFEFTRPELLWRLELLFEPVRRQRRNAPRGTPELPFGDVAELVFPARILPRIPDFTPAEKLRLEGEILGVFVSDHPLALHAAELQGLERERAADLTRLAGRRVRLAGWPIACRRVFTKNRKYMKFLTLEDETDIYEAVLFPEAYERWGHLTSEPGPLVVEGRVVDEFGSIAVDVSRLQPLVPPERRRARGT